MKPFLPSPGRRPAPSRRIGSAAFTLIEVMIAMGIFFVATFAILSLVAQNLRIARGLHLGEVDIGTVAAEIMVTTNLSEGTLSGDFGDAYSGATWNAEVFMVGTNGNSLRSLTSGQGLYQADIVVDWPQNGAMRQKTASILIYRGTSANRGPQPR